MSAKTKIDKTLAVQDGLSSYNSYVILHHNSRAGIHLAIKPQCERIDQNTIWLGGRLRCAWDYQGRHALAARPKKYENLTYEEYLNLPRNEYPGIDWQTGSHMRSSTTVGILIAAGRGDQKTFKKMWDEVDFPGALLDELKAKTGKTFSGVRAAGGKATMMEELWTRYEKQMSGLFSSSGSYSIPEKVLGEVSGLLNRFAKRGWSGPRDAFTQRIAKEVTKASA